MMQAEPPFPRFPVRDRRARNERAYGRDDHLRDLIHLVLFTASGERVNRPEFGCGVKQLVFAPASDALAAATEQLIHGALIRWLDPVHLGREGVGPGGDDATLEITVVYARADTGERREEVFRHPVPA